MPLAALAQESCKKDRGHDSGTVELTFSRDDSCYKSQKLRALVGKKGKNMATIGSLPAAKALRMRRPLGPWSTLITSQVGFRFGAQAAARFTLPGCPGCPW